jgi:hypothetical protein
MSQFFPSGATIKSIQRGVIDLNSVISQTATISSVVTAKTELRFLGCSTNSPDTLTQALPRIALTNATTITATRGSSSNQSVVSWELTEWN